MAIGPVAFDYWKSFTAHVDCPNLARLARTLDVFIDVPRLPNLFAHCLDDDDDDAGSSKFRPSRSGPASNGPVEM